MPLWKDLNIFPTNTLYFQDGELFKMLSMALVCPKSQSHVINVSLIIDYFYPGSSWDLLSRTKVQLVPSWVVVESRADGVWCDALIQPKLGMAVTCTTRDELEESEANSWAEKLYKQGEVDTRVSGP